MRLLVIKDGNAAAPQ